MGIKLRELSEGAARLEMPISPELMNSNGTLYGGAVASLLDAVIGVTIRSKWSTRISTVYLTTTTTRYAKASCTPPPRSQT